MVHQPGQAEFRSILPEDIDWKPFPAFIGTGNGGRQRDPRIRSADDRSFAAAGRIEDLSAIPRGVRSTRLSLSHTSEAGKLDALPRLGALQNSTGLRCRRERACLSLLDGNTLRYRRRLAS